jgi:hypothetical protein
VVQGQRRERSRRHGGVGLGKSQERGNEAFDDSRPSAEEVELRNSIPDRRPEFVHSTGPDGHIGYVGVTHGELPGRTALLQRHAPLVRLLLIGLPLTVIAGTLAARVAFRGDAWATAALLAVILAPTDAALGLGVFTDRSVPPRIRRALTVESGLNDGIVRRPVGGLRLVQGVEANKEPSERERPP